MTRVLGRYDVSAVRDRFEEAGVLNTLRRKGFGAFDLQLQSVGVSLPHVQLWGEKEGTRCLLLDACLGEAVVRPAFFIARGYPMDQPLELAVVHWAREQDPTVAFPAQRPPLPLQQHPGLGVLRQVFRVAVKMAGELNKDGVASIPKFLHDAVIFYRSRLFLFLDGWEQGRFEALVRDLQALPLGDASLAVASDCVRNADGETATWEPSYQVFPLSAKMTAHFHSPRYAARVAEALATCRFMYDSRALAHMREALANGTTEVLGSVAS